jgi:hypothetical protein
MGETMTSAPANSKLKRVATGLLVAILVAACGGGGGGGGPAPQPSPSPAPLPPATGPGDAANHFPAAFGDTWYFNASATSGTTTETGIGTVSVTGTKAIRGQTSTVFAERVYGAPAGTPAYEMYYTELLGGVAYYGDNDPSDAVTAGMVPYTELLFPVQLGPITSFAKTGLNYGDDLDGDGRNETFDASYSSSIAGLDTVTVPAGTFAGAARRVANLTVDVRLSSNGQVVTVTGVDTSWLAPGAGLIKRTSSVTAPGTSIAVDTLLEARGYVVGGVRRGFSVPVPLLDNLGPLTQMNSGQFPHWSDTPAIASDGTNFLVVGKRWAPVSGRFGVTRTGAIVTADGTVDRAFDIGPQILSNDTRDMAAAAFHAGVYLAVFEQRNPPAGGGFGSTETSVVMHRIASNGDLIDLSPVELVPQGIFLGSDAGLDSRFPAVAGGGGNFVVVNYTGLHPDSYLEGRLITPAGAVGTAFRISPNHGARATPSVIYDGTNFVVAYVDPSGVRVARVTGAGIVLDPGGVPVHTSPVWPELATDGVNRLVAWIENDTVYAKRLNADGTPLDPVPIAVTSGDTQPKAGLTVINTGGEYLMAWTRQLTTPANGLAVYIARLGIDGQVKSTGNAGMLASPTALPPPGGATGGYALPTLGRGNTSLLVFLEGAADAISSTDRIAGMHAVSVYPFAP